MAVTKVQIAISNVATNGDYVGKVVKGWESFQITVKGENYTKKREWTIWLDQATDIKKGDVIEFIGELNTKTDGTPHEYQGRTYFKIEHSLNNCTWQKITSAPETETPAPAPSGEMPF